MNPIPEDAPEGSFPRFVRGADYLVRETVAYAKSGIRQTLPGRVNPSSRRAEPPEGSVRHWLRRALSTAANTRDPRQGSCEALNNGLG